MALSSRKGAQKKVNGDDVDNDSTELTVSEEFNSTSSSESEREAQPLLGGLNDAPVPPHINLLQRGVGGAIAWFDATFTLIVCTAVARFYDLQINSPGVFPTSAVVWVVMLETSKGARALATQQEPFRAICAAGGGSFAKGLGREAVNKGIPLAAIAGSWTYANALFTYYFDIANGDPVNHQTLLYLLSVLSSPVEQASIIALLTGGTYLIGHKLIACCWPTPTVPPEDNPDTRWFQKLLDMGVRIIYGVVASEVARETMNTAIGYAKKLHVKESMVYAMPLVFLIRDPLDYYARMPRPISRLDIPWIEQPRMANAIPDLGAVGGPVAPGQCRNVAGLSIRVGIAVAAMAAVYGLNWAVMRFYVDPNCQEPQDPVSNDTAVSNVTNAYHHNNMRGFCDPDPADLSYPERMGILAFLTGAGIVVQKAALHAPSAVRAVRSVCSWVGSLWQRSPSNPAPDVEQGVQPRVVAL